MYIISILLLGILGCVQQSEESIYVIPKGYHGTMLILFNQKTGVPPKYKNGKRLYELPKNGILKTQFSPNRGVGASRFELNTKNFNESGLKYMTSVDWKRYPVDSEEIVCWNLEPGVTETQKKEKINFEVFSVDSIKQSETISDERAGFVFKTLSAY